MAIPHEDDRGASREAREATARDPGSEPASASASASAGRELPVEREEWFRELVVHCPDYISLHDTDGRLLYCNPAVERFLAVTLSKMKGRTPTDAATDPSPVSSPEAATMFESKVLEVARTGRPIDGEGTWPAADGGPPIHHHIRVFPVFDRDGRLHGIASYGRDISEVRAAEREVARTNARLQQLFDALPDQVWLKDAEGRYLASNPAFEQLVGVGQAEIRGRTDDRFFPEEQASQRAQRDREALRSGSPTVSEEWVVPAAGAGRRLLETVRTRMTDAEGTLIGVLGVARDVTQQHQAEELLHKREQEFRALVENSPDPVVRYDRSARRVYVNPAFERLAGATAAELVGIAPRDAFVGNREVGALTQEAVEAVLRDGTSRMVEATWKTAAGAVRCFQVTYVPELDRNGAVTSVLSVARDISALKRSEEELRKLSRAVEQSPASILITDTSGTIEYVNPKFCELTGYSVEEAVGRKPSIVKSGETPASEYARLWRTIRAGKEWRGEFHNRKKSGELYWESVSISPVLGSGGTITHYVAVKEDISEHKRLEEELRQAQKMEAFGQLAGGVAHDFNNLLTVIQGNATQLQEYTLSPADRATCVEQILEAADRATRLTRQMLLFSRRQPPLLCDLDLNLVVSDMARMLRRLIGEHIRVEVRCSPGAAPVHADQGMMEQVLMNLAVNARDAMPRGGELVIETRVVEHAGEGPHRGMPPGRYVHLSLTDSGRGIEPEHLPHVFEPFFTTKEVGKGTGLGLATVFGIVEQHGGWTDVESRVGVGTTFRVFLPALTTFAATRTAPAAALATGGTETVLVVEDDAAVRSVAQKVLRRNGYRVHEADTAAAALEIWAHHRDEIDLVLTDMVMPGGMNGRDLVDRLRAEKPALRVIFSTGYTDVALGEGAGTRTLEKPYEPAELLRSVRSCLDEGRGRKP